LEFENAERRTTVTFSTFGMKIISVDKKGNVESFMIFEKVGFGIWNAHGTQRTKTFDFLFKKSILTALVLQKIYEKISVRQSRNFLFSVFT
jgi:hypothetical protein